MHRCVILKLFQSVEGTNLLFPGAVGDTFGGMKVRFHFGVLLDADSSLGYQKGPETDVGVLINVLHRLGLQV